jgi:hypothetical protein
MSTVLARATARKSKCAKWRWPHDSRASFHCLRPQSHQLAWTIQDGVAQATITASGDIPMPKALPKPPKPKVPAAWKPSIWDAVYRLDAYAAENRRRPGFVVEHSCGLSLVHPSETEEWGIGDYGADEDIRQNWRLTHTASGLGFGLTLTFKRATDALLLATSLPVDWTQGVAGLQANAEFKRAGHTVLATYGTGYQKHSATLSLERAA